MNNQADLIISHISKALKRFTHESSNKFIDALIKEPLKTVSEHETEFNKLKDSLIKELKNGNIELKDKQGTKAIQSLENNELVRLAKEYSIIRNETGLDTTALKKKDEITQKIKELMTQEEAINNENKNIKKELENLALKKTDLTERLAGKSSMTFNQKIIISP